MAAVLGLALQPGRAWADEADNFTCRGRVTRDSLAILDGWVNARLREAIEQANRPGKKPCDEACLSRLLQDGIGGSSPKGITFIPGSRFAKWVNGQADIDRCHLAFKDTIYGARRYDQPWRFPFLHRIIFVADSIRLSGQLVGVDKVDHFIREGLAHWQFIEERGVDIAASMAHEVGEPGHGMAWTEHGVKGMSLTGVFAYADLAAGYFGYRFWQDALALGRTGSFVSRDAATGRYSQRRTFTFADYVNDAWDETLNCSTFTPALGVEVAAALAKRAMTCGTTDPAIRARFIALPDAALYLNPANLKGEARPVKRGLEAALRSPQTWPGKSAPACARISP
jgi:hypothetical protein